MCYLEASFCLHRSFLGYCKLNTSISWLGRVSLAGKVKRRKPCLFQMRFCGAFDVRETEESLEERSHAFDALGMNG